MTDTDKAMAQGNTGLPPALANSLASLSTGSPRSVGEALQNPQIAQQIIPVLTQALSQQNGAQNALNQLSNIAMAASGAQNLLQNPQAFAQTITAALQQIAPQLAQQLTQALGGNLTAALGNAIGAAAQQAQQQAQEQQQQQAQQGGGCTGCGQCANCPVKINQNHVTIRTHETAEFESHRSWIVTTWWVKLVAPALAAMSSQFSANMMEQVMAIGEFFDAKHQLETQRLFQTMTAKTHKDYHPSQELCAIGTNIRSLASSEQKTDLVHMAIANRMMQRQLSAGDALSTRGSTSDRRTRLKAVIDNYCRPTDMGGEFNKLCKATDKQRMNMDVDYTAAIENKLTLKLNFTQNGASDITEDEENILSLSANLFAHNVIEQIPSSLLGTAPDKIYDNAYDYLRYRGVAAKRSIAQNSFAAITALKAEGDDSQSAAAPFLKAILAEIGVNPNEVEKRLGENPSYFAQMEVLTKDLYQNPTFYSNLYDKPVNVERKSASLQAIELMQDRDIYKSLIRSEAVLATLVETLLQDEHRRISASIKTVGEGG